MLRNATVLILLSMLHLLSRQLIIAFQLCVFPQPPELCRLHITSGNSNEHHILINRCIEYNLLLKETVCRNCQCLISFRGSLDIRAATKNKTSFLAGVHNSEVTCMLPSTNGSVWFQNFIVCIVTQNDTNRLISIITSGSHCQHSSTLADIPHGFFRKEQLISILVIHLLQQRTQIATTAHHNDPINIGKSNSRLTDSFL